MLAATSEQPIWHPQEGPQKALVACPLREIFFGGARGGGKTDGVLGKYALKAQKYGYNFNAVFFRRELPMLDDAIERSKELYTPLGARWIEQKKTWWFPGGGRLRFRPLERVEDAAKYQGQNVTDCCVEEAGTYPDPSPIWRLFGVLRSARGVPTQLILTGNPGGPGQQWIKERYIDPAPMGMKILERALPNGATHKSVFIPSKIKDNKLLLEADPEYINNLYLVGSPELVRAWLEGDWSAIEGAYFPEWSPKHVLTPFAVPRHWARFRSMDWGYAKPFSVGWFAVSTGITDDGQPMHALNALGEAVHVPKGALVRYREWYGKRAANEGLRLTPEQVAAGILEREAGDLIDYGVADPAIFKEEGGPSIGETFLRAGIMWRRADNARVAGWTEVRARLVGVGGVPMSYVFSTCTDLIRTLPALEHDKNKPEDCDSDGEDHCFTGETLIATSEGAKPIAELQRPCWVLMPNGEYEWTPGARQTLKSVPVISLYFDGGLTVRCTKNHRFLTADGWIEAQHMKGRKALCASLELARQFKSLTENGTISAASIFSAKVSGFIEKFGGLLTAQFLKAFTSITETATALTTTWQTFNFCPVATTAVCTAQNPSAKQSVSETSKSLDWRPANGTDRQRALNGISATMKKAARILCTPECRRYASSAERISQAPNTPAFAQTPAKLSGGAFRKSTTRIGRALSAAVRFPSRAMQMINAALVRAVSLSAHLPAAECLSLSESGTADVYCFHIDNWQSFALANGVVVHNSADDHRYAHMSRPFLRERAKPQEPMRDIKRATLNELWQMQEEEQQYRRI